MPLQVASMGTSPLQLPLPTSKFDRPKMKMQVFHQKKLLPTFAHYALLIAGAILAMPDGGISDASVDIPPILSECFTPLSPSQAATWAEELLKQKPINNVPTFCKEAGFLCDEQVEASSNLLYSFSTYRFANTNETHLQANLESLFFKESLLSLGSLLQLPSFQEPPLPMRAFLPPSLRPLLFDPPTSLLPQVLLPFGFHASSPLALSMQHTLHLCTSPPIHHETKACVPTFEGMLHFATSAIGTTDVVVLSNPILPPQQIVAVVRLEEVAKGVAISCHNMMFPFQVFYCHHIKGTKVFKATLQMELGDNVKNISALASCHPHESSSISHKLANSELLCHWNYGDNIVWVPL
ncbi:hypothetical protein GOP47_0024590 [Adiantum capillus-veneris]|uniref:BURP domain-containing protein n=1 Tax=Adiantum capillus-veneris TaxID=13818 RepID=A0A9D4U2F0_ADICA|nr:hypothetical protein GOP47_0024590 [Adiantum capillus-veneris]